MIKEQYIILHEEHDTELTILLVTDILNEAIEYFNNYIKNNFEYEYNYFNLNEFNRIKSLSKECTEVFSITDFPYTLELHIFKGESKE
jgi:hypothetical protein